MAKPFANSGDAGSELFSNCHFMGLQTTMNYVLPCILSLRFFFFFFFFCCCFFFVVVFSVFLALRSPRFGNMCFSCVCLFLHVLVCVSFLFLLVSGIGCDL